MKITSFNPLIVTKDSEAAIKLFEELGFKRHHTKEGVDGQANSGVVEYRMKDDNGFYVDITQAQMDIPKDYTFIRMNVSDLDEAYNMLTERGFRMAKGFDDAVDTGTSRYRLMVSPTGTIMSITEHIK